MSEVTVGEFKLDIVFQPNPIASEVNQDTAIDVQGKSNIDCSISDINYQEEDSKSGQNEPFSRENIMEEIPEPFEN